MNDTHDDHEHNLREGAITRLVAQKRNAERVSVFIDDAFAFGLALDLVLSAGLKKGQRLTVLEQEALLDKEQIHRVRAAALDYLTYGARTAYEVRRKLRQKGFEPHAVDDGIAHLEGYGYLDDEAYARAFARGRFTGRGYGPQRLRADLQKRGVAKETIEAVLAELVETEDLNEAAMHIARPKWAALAREPDLRKRKKKATDFLLRRGYSFDIARQTIDALMIENPPDEPDDDFD